MEWTNDQKKVIDSRSDNILVSASAGSGKTAVLVARIMAYILQDKVDIDDLLIVTFTRAAAGEMRERIAKAIADALEKDPDNEHLTRQTTLIHNAQITTIDGFCSYVLRGYFHLIGLDPGFRVAEEGELTLLREEVMEELLEESYASQDPDFLYFAECFAPGKGDDPLGELIQKIYDTSMSSPYPEKWLEKCRSMYQVRDEGELAGSLWLSLMWENVEADLADCRTLMQDALEISALPEGPSFFTDQFQEELSVIRRLSRIAGERDFEKTAQEIREAAFKRLPGKKAPGESPVLRKAASDKRSEAKKLLDEIRDTCFLRDPEEILRELRQSGRAIGELITLVESFSSRYAAAKEEKNLLDFSDLEHLALKVLQTDEGERTPAARELSERYDEIMIDEYQDSNMVQEYIARAVSGWAGQRENLFMVGDVKQSIYRFRLARPELFMEKYETYTLEESRSQRIDLHRNFRSRREIIDSVNYIFRQVMNRDLGGITYDEAAALHYGADYPEPAEPCAAEVILVDKDSDELAEEAGTDTAQQLEALAIAQRIQRMVGKEQVYDRALQCMRPVTFGDIAVLLRSASGWADVFSEVFTSRGIPNYKMSRTGYFSASEIVCILNYLKICNNPRQDIPLAGVLRSPIGGVSAQELAELRIRYPDGLLYDSVRASCDEKLVQFCRRLDGFRERAVYTPIHELILEILLETGYGRYIRVLPDGAQRTANLNMLVEKAKEFEKTSYHGLFSFIRYIEKLRKYEVDFGEVNLAEDSAGCVQIMTIHKSKGLEYPVVFTAGLGKRMNFRDLEASVLTHPEYGMGMDQIDLEMRTRAPGFVKKLLARQLKREMLGEELRILYVAMTRAKEKLILTGTLGGLDKKIPELSSICLSTNEVLPFRLRYKASTGWDYVLPALARHRALDGLYEKYGLHPQRVTALHDDPSPFVFRLAEPLDLAGEDAAVLISRDFFFDRLSGLTPDRVYDSRLRQMLDERFDYVYPWEYLKDLPVKYSVSELKKRSWHEDGEAEDMPFVKKALAAAQETPSDSASHPAAGSSSGAERGTAYHRFFECLDYGKAGSEEDLRLQLQALTDSRKMTREQADFIDVSDFEIFLQTSIGKRMGQAFLSGTLSREQPFVFSLPAREADSRFTTDEPVLIQGIIDAWFVEPDGQIVLVDYKTDRVGEGGEEYLSKLYHVQLEEYANALERLTGRKVKEKYLYSVCLGREIRV